MTKTGCEVLINKHDFVTIDVSKLTNERGTYLPDNL